MKLQQKSFSLCFSFLLLSMMDAHAQIGMVDRNMKNKPSLTIVGTYHMGTPGNNVANGIVDDISSSDRQKQIVQLIEKLQTFKPTKIVVECDLDKDAKTQENYEQYLSGNYQLSKNETNQIGFRLAKEMDLKKVFCVDWSDFWDDPNINLWKYAAKDLELNDFVKKIDGNIKKEVDEESNKLLGLTVIEQLAFLNQPNEIEKNHQVYFDYMRIGRGKEYIGANYVSWWYRRNLTIFDNIIRLTDSSNDRILVIYGAGHLKLLTQFAVESGFYQVDSPLKYLRNQK